MPPEGLFIDNTHPALASFWHPVAMSEELEAGPIGVGLLGRRWAVARLASGAVAAYPDRCPHRLAPLSAGTVEGESVRCAYHGYRFAADGTCVEIPALGPSAVIPARASCGAAAGVAERYGLVWLAPSEPLVPIPSIPEWDEGWTPMWLSEEWAAGAAQMTDNFLDVAHFPFTHRGSFGDADDREVEDYTVERDGWSFVARHVHQARHVGPDGAFGEATERVQTFTYTPPHVVHLRLTHDSSGTASAMVFLMQPVSVGVTRLWVLDLHRDLLDAGVDAEQLRKARLQVAAEDRDLLTRFPQKWLPLDLPYEVHTRADKITVELRRVLREIVG